MVGRLRVFALVEETARAIPYADTTVATPIGSLRLVAGERGLVAIDWHASREKHDSSGACKASGHPVLRDAERQLHEYFDGRRKVFALPLDFRGTEFQKRVWLELLDIPFGQTRSYGEIAARLGNPKAVRAVGAANGRNPIPIVAPCHRVIGASGDLVGFGGGLDLKARLLDFERGALAFDFGSAKF